MSKKEIDIVIKNVNAIKVNGKYVVRTGTGDWVKQMAPYTEAEIEAVKEIAARLDEGRKKSEQIYS